MSTATTGLVLIGHGSHLSPDSARPIFAHADQIRATEAFDSVRVSFWKEEPSPREVLRTVPGGEVYVVPVFMSTGYFTTEVLPRELRLEGSEPLDVDKRVHYTDPVGTHPAMAGVIDHRARSAVGDARDPSEVGLAVIGHGTDRNSESARSTRAHVARLRKTGRFSEVRSFFMDEAPEVHTVYNELSTPAIVVVPLFVADGYHTREDNPRLLGIETATGHNQDGSWSVDGRHVWYTGAVGTDPFVAAVVLERAQDAGATVTGTLTELRQETEFHRGLALAE